MQGSEVASCARNAARVAVAAMELGGEAVKMLWSSVGWRSLAGRLVAPFASWWGSSSRRKLCTD